MVSLAKVKRLTYKLDNSLAPFNHVSTVAKLSTNLFTLLQFKTHKTSI